MLVKLILEQVSYSLETKSDIDDDVSSFGVSISSKEENDEGGYTYILIGDPDNITRLILNVNGPAGIKNNNAAIVRTQSLGNGDNILNY